MQRLRTRLRASASRGAPAALSLDFLSASGALDPRITFSRGSNATLTDSTGKITYAPTNLLVNSESLDASSWSKDNVNISANAAVAPNGTTTADKIVENTATAIHRLSSGGSITLTSGVAYSMSVYAKADGVRYLYINYTAQLGASATFDLQNGVVATVGAGTANIESVGNGWYRCSVRGVAPATAAATFYLQLNTNGNASDNSYLGNGINGIFVWGAQLSPVTYQTTPGTYNSTTPKNLLGFTQEFDNAAWTKTNATVTANAVYAPDGTLTADKLVENTAASTAHYVDFSSTSLVPTGSVVTASVYLKAGERNWINLNLGTAQSAYFNLATGTVGTTVGTLIGTSITSVGNGWWRCSITATTAASTGRLSVYIATANGTLSYTGDGTSGIYVWGAQLSDSASLDPYVYNPAAAAASAAYYGPRFDYDPVTLAAKGLLIEEARTNLVTYSAQFDDAAWSKFNATVTANATTAPDGTSAADTLVETATTNFHFIQNAYTTTGALSFSVFLKENTRRFGGIHINDGAARGCSIDLRTGTLGTPYGGATASVVNYGNGWFRLTVTATAGAAGNVVVYVSDSNALASYAGNGTSGIFIYGAQLEAGSFATSYIPTVASQVTRSADVATMIGDNFRSWYNQNEGTFVFGFTPDSTVANNTRVANISQGDATGRVVDVNSDGTSWLSYNGSGNSVIGSAAVTSATRSIAAAYKTGDYAGVIGGGTVATRTDALVNIPTQMRIGAFSASIGFLNGHIRSLGYYNTRQPNATLQTLTNPSTTPSLALNFISDTYTVGA